MSQQPSHPYSRFVKRLWIAFVIVLLSVPCYIFTVSINLWYLYGGLPSVAILQNPKHDLSSELYAADGVLLGKYFRYNRSPAEYEEISQNVIHALLATEE